MFLFITMPSSPIPWKQRLNTSHVLIYRKIKAYIQFCLAGLNTSHVLIYLFCNLQCRCNYSMFKYISCSYLSFAPEQFGKAIMLFKYISCSYLSVGKTAISKIEKKFKYISCSYLSMNANPILLVATCLNTSHVLIYPVTMAKTVLSQM